MAKLIQSYKGLKIKQTTKRDDIDDPIIVTTKEDAIEWECGSIEEAKEWIDSYWPVRTTYSAQAFGQEFFRTTEREYSHVVVARWADGFSHNWAGRLDLAKKTAQKVQREFPQILEVAIVPTVVLKKQEIRGNR